MTLAPDESAEQLLVASTSRRKVALARTNARVIHRLADSDTMSIEVNSSEEADSTVAELRQAMADAGFDIVEYDGDRLDAGIAALQAAASADDIEK